MKKLIFLLLTVLLFILINCSSPLEGFGVKPAAIENVSLSGEDGSLTVTWSKTDLADSYKVFMNVSETIPAEPYAIVKGTSITIPNLLNDVTYYVWVVPFNKLGEQIPEMIFSGTIPLSVPQGVTSEKTTNDTIKVTWQPVALADEYEIFCKTSSIQPTVSDTPNQNVSVNSVIFSGLNQPDYYIWIKAKNSRGKSALSGMIRDSFALSVPQGVTSEKTASDTIKVTWQPVALADEYEIFYRTNPVAPVVSDMPDQIVPVNSAILSGLDHPEYYIWIKAKSPRGKSAFSSMIRDSFALSMPEEVTSEKIAVDAIKVSWKPVTLADEYEVFCKTSPVQPAVSDTPDQTVSVNSAVLSGLDQLDYYIWIKAKSPRGKSAFSGMMHDSFIVSNFKVSAINESGISLEWEHMNGASGYNIYRSTDENGTYSKIHTDIVSDTKFVNTDISRYTTYYYKVSATIGDIEAPQSNSVSASYGILVPGSGVSEKLAWLQNNATSDTFYGIEVNANEYLVPQVLSYTGKSGILITMSGIGAARNITLSAGGSLFTIGSGVTLILDNNISLNGRNGNTASLITINKGGTMVMNAGSKITGNSNASSSTSGGGVYVAGTFSMNGGEISGNTLTKGVAGLFGGGGVYVGEEGTFTMNGGAISGNTVSSEANRGGGVYVTGIFIMNNGKISGNTINSSISGQGGGVCVFEGAFFMNGGEISGNSVSTTLTSQYAYARGGGVWVYSRYVSPAISIGYFIMSGGVIYGSNAATNLRNTAKSDGAALWESGGSSAYGTYSGDIFYQSGKLTTTNNTIRVVNGNWQTN